jgi:signal transduction histidine kinase
LWGIPIPRKYSVFSRFRLAGASVMIGVALVGAAFYGAVNSHFLSLVIGRTLGPYSDTLAEHGFASPDSDIWQRMAARHDVTILIQPPVGDPVAFDIDGEPLSPSTLGEGQIRATRTGADGTRVTFYWTLWSFEHSHMAMMGGLLVMVTLVVGSAFWFLQQQLKPLAWLHSGVDAVARGDFKTRVPVVRNDEIGHVAKAFNEMASRVGEMIDDRERLLADVSHELRSPIARMKVALEFMPEGDKRESLARDMREMENLIAVLLEREELRSRTGRLEGQDMDLEAIAGEVAATFGDQGPGVELISDGAISIHADPALIKLLIQNLVDNAVKFSRADSRPVAVKLECTKDDVTLRVTDDGIGIPDGSDERLFEPFVKLDRARGHRVGYGIGLNLCQRIVQLHGGTIRLLPREPRGTEAVVTLRRAVTPDPLSRR